MLQSLDQTLTLWLNGSHSLFADGIAWTATQTVTWVPVMLLLLYVIIRNNNLTGIAATLTAIGLCVLLADQVASSIFKPLVARYRPTNDPELMYMVDVVNAYRGGRYGFFSSHAANTMAVATFLSLLVRQCQLTCWLVSWSLLNCWTRVYLGVHYVGDLMTGLLWGIAVGFMVHYAMYRLFPSLQTLAKRRAALAGFTAGGYSVATVRMLIAGLLATYVAITVRAAFF